MRTYLIFPILLFIILACGRKNSGTDSSAHEHEHSDKNIQLTVYSDSAEFYVDFPPLTASHKEAFMVHLTRLKDHKPFLEGEVKITADFGENQSSAIAEHPVAPGIWRVLLRPEYAGECKILFEYNGKAGNTSAEYSSVHVAMHNHEKEPGQETLVGTDETNATHEQDASHGQDASHDQDESHESENPLGDIQFTKEQAWKSDFRVELIKPAPFSGIIKTGGEILAMPSQKYFIHARNSGIVNFSKKELVAGSNVSSGEELMSIEGQNLAAGNITVEYAQAETHYIQSRSKYERHLKLLQENALSEAQFIETRAEYITDSIRFFNLKKSFDGKGLRIQAPIAGHIHDLDVSQGEYVEEGQLLATLSSDKQLLLRADVPQQYFSRIQDIITCNFRTSYHKKVWDIKDLNGRLIALGSSVAENNQYLPVYFEAHNNGELLEGAFAEFYLKTRAEENSILIPVQSVLEEQGSYYVYIQVSGENYQKRKIQLGDTDGYKYLVLAGIHDGERIVTRGSMLIKAASMSSAIPGHSHAH